MTQFQTLTPKQAIELVEAGGAADARKLLADHAAAGLVKSYAKVQTTIDARGVQADVRGAAVPRTIWQRMIRDNACTDVWDGGMVRLAGSDLIGGEPALQITGLSFHPADVRQLADDGRPKKAPAKSGSGSPPAATTTATPAAAAQPALRRANPAAIPPGALLATIAQTEAALGFGRTKINELMNNGTLVRVKKGYATRIDVASIRAFAGITLQADRAGPM